MSGNSAGRVSMPRRPHSRRDGGGRWRNKNQQSSDDGDGGKANVSVPQGSCTTMCPAYELRQREAQNRLHRFEMLAGTERERLPRADVSRAVKEYSRPAAGKDSTRASDLRPPDVLLKTVCYLVDDVAASTTLQPWTEVYSFVFDRLRSVRQDMIIQRVSGPVCVAVLERTVRFLLYAEHRLCGQPLRCFDPRINHTHLQESLSWLLECYREGSHLHQDQFQALNLLYNLDSPRTTQHALELPATVRCSPPVRLALEIGRAYADRNPVRLLRLVRRLDFLQACALHRHLLACRTLLLLLYSHGHSSRNCRFPLPKLAELLHLERDATACLCQAHGVKIDVGEENVIFSKASFTEKPAVELQCSPTHRLVDEKQKDLTVRDVLHGLKA